MLVKRLARAAAPALLLTVAVSLVTQATRQPIRAAGQAAPSTPRLVVMIVLDQVRADYLERFADDWAGGLQRMMKAGAWFTNAAYPYLVTATCAGHATVSSGTLPHKSGIVHNEWFDRRQQKVVTCTADPTVRDIDYDAQASSGVSTAAL